MDGHRFFSVHHYSSTPEDLCRAPPQDRRTIRTSAKSVNA